MNYRLLGSTDIDASVVAFGAWAVGGWMWGGTDEAEGIKAIHAAVDAGINLIDTAPMYGFGRSEEIVGKAIKDRRDKVVLATKSGLLWDREQGEFFFHCDDKQPTEEPSRYKVYIYQGPESIREEIEKSLKRLQTDYIDLYQTHWQDPTTPLEDTVNCLTKLKEEGKIRAIGACNATPEQMDVYRRIGVLAVDQEKYSMLDRQLEATNLPYCLENNIAVLAYSPLAQGLLTGKITPERKFEEGDLRNKEPRYSVENRRKVMSLLGVIQPIASDHGVSLVQLAIAWTVAQPGLTHALCGARNPEQAVENAAAGDLSLSDEELAAITRAIETHAADFS